MMVKADNIWHCFRHGRGVILLCVLMCALASNGKRFVVADSTTRAPLSSASIFNKNGQFVATSNVKGEVKSITRSDYPITVRYLGFAEKLIPLNDADTVFLEKTETELPEVVVESKKNNRLHILAYMREYSTLSSYTDTVTMFREKMVDFMLPVDKDMGSHIWLSPRVLSVKSYFQFTDSEGLDSVSSHCNHHFTWSDWISIFPTMGMPSKLADGISATDTIRGKYSPTEIWTKDNDRVSVDVDVLADTCSRRWVPKIVSFFNREDTDFDRFHIRANYDNVIGKELKPTDLNSFSYNMESRGRGRQMFMFNRKDEPFYVTTYMEVYILDREYISMREAKRLEKGNFHPEDIMILVPSDAPKLSDATLALIDRVDNVDTTKVRLDSKPDEKLLSPYYGKEYFLIDRAAVKLVKKLGRAIFGL